MMTVGKLKKILKNIDNDVVVIGTTEEDSRRGAWVSMKGYNVLQQKKIRVKDRDGVEFSEFVNGDKSKYAISCLKICF